MTNLITNPPHNWVERLRPGHSVWLSKEQQEAVIDFAYEPPEPGFRCGRIGICHSGAWFVGLNGEGINGSLLLQPIEGHLPENPEPLPEPLIRQMQRAMERLDNRVRTLENTLVYGFQPGDAELFSGFGLVAELNPTVCIEDPCSYCNGTGKAIKPIEK